MNHIKNGKFEYFEFSVDGFTTEPQLLLSSKSYLIDRIVPNIEYISLPPESKSSGVVRVSITKDAKAISYQHRSRKSLLLEKVQINPSIERMDKDQLCVDFRIMSPENWSHILNLHIPFAYFLIYQLKSKGVENNITFILPKQTPRHVLSVFSHFKLNFLTTDSTIVAREIEIEYDMWGLIQVGRHRWVRDYIRPLFESGHLFPSDASKNRKIFLSRKDTRKIENESEVSDIVKSFGYTTIYAEDFSPKDQISLFRNAEDIVAIHGAGLGPLLYCQDRLSSVIEIFSPGHLSSHYRTMCNLLRIPWIGLRGKLEEKHVKQAYSFNKPFRKHSLDNFCIDCSTLEFALNNLEPLKKFQPNFPKLNLDSI